MAWHDYTVTAHFTVYAAQEFTVTAESAEDARALLDDALRSGFEELDIYRAKFDKSDSIELDWID